MSSGGFDLLYENGPCFAINKHAGVPTQSQPGQDSLAIRLQSWLAARRPSNGQHNLPNGATALDPSPPTACSAQRPYLGVPQRLDRPVSGVMVFATTSRAARSLSRQFERRRVRKLYWACVSGQVDPPSGTWVDHLRKTYGIPQARIVPESDPAGRRAVLRYRTIARTAWGSCLEIELETGRTHQIRVQAASRGYPVLGDQLYGSPVPFGPLPLDDPSRAIALHSRLLSFFQPATRQPIHLTAPLPAAWSALELPTDLT